MWVVLLIAAVAALIWYLGQSGRQRDKGREESPEEILKRRYAKGEIEKEEYERRLEDLRG